MINRISTCKTSISILSLLDFEKVGSIKELSKKTQLDYWNTMSWVKDLEHAGLVRVEKGKGNKKIIYLTDEGKELAGLVVRLLSKERELLKDEEEFYEIV